MGLLDGLFDKEGIVSGTIENCVISLSEELNCKPNELLLMIKPVTDEFKEGGDNIKYWVYQVIDGKPKLIREISLKEILGD